MTFFTRKLLSTYHNIHNTVRDDNELYHWLSVKGTFYTVELHDRSLDKILRQSLLQPDFITAFAINLHGNCYFIIDN